jgi:hypothetical protein
MDGILINEQNHGMMVGGDFVHYLSFRPFCPKSILNGKMT